jgi:hypothetical protein
VERVRREGVGGGEELGGNRVASTTFRICFVNFISFTLVSYVDVRMFSTVLCYLHLYCVGRLCRRLEINAEKTKYMIMSRHPYSGQNQNIKTANESFENVANSNSWGRH